MKTKRPCKHRVEPRDVPADLAALRLGMTEAKFEVVLPLREVSRSRTQTPGFSIYWQSTSGATRATPTCSAAVE